MTGDNIRDPFNEIQEAFKAAGITIEEAIQAINKAIKIVTNVIESIIDIAAELAEFEELDNQPTFKAETVQLESQKKSNRPIRRVYIPP